MKKNVVCQWQDPAVLCLPWLSVLAALEAAEASAALGVAPWLFFF